MSCYLPIPTPSYFLSPAAWRFFLRIDFAKGSKKHIGAAMLARHIVLERGIAVMHHKGVAPETATVTVHEAQVHQQIGKQLFGDADFLGGVADVGEGIGRHEQVKVSISQRFCDIQAAKQEIFRYAR